MPISKIEAQSNELVAAIVEAVLRQAATRSPSFSQEILYCAVPRWFDVEVVAGMCQRDDTSTSRSNEILEYLCSLPFSEAHPTREATWMFKEAFRVYLLSQKEVTDSWAELQTRAANIFERRWATMSGEGEKRLKDPDSKSSAVEYIYHLQRLDPVKAASVVRHICAETLAIWTSTGGRPEVTFCLEFLGSLDCPEGSAQAAEFSSLQAGMKELSTYDDEKALGMLYDLAAIQDLSASQRGALSYWIGSTHLRNEGRLAPALSQLEKALELGTNNATVQAELAAVYYWPGLLWGRLDLARKHARESGDPPDVSGCLVWAHIAELEEDYDEAIVWCRKAIKVEPDFFNGYLSLSEIYTARGDLERTLEMIEKAVEQSPDIQYYALVRRGNAFRDARRYPEALVEYHKAVVEAPDRVDSYLGMGDLHASLWQTTEAEQLFRKALELNPSGARPYTSLAKLYLQEEKLDQLFTISQQAKAAGLESKELLVVLLDAYRSPDYLEDFQRVQKQILKLDPAEEYAAHCAVGDLWLAKAEQQPQKRWFTRAQREYDNAEAIDPRRAWAYLSMGRLAVIRNDPDAVQRQKALVRERAPWAINEMLVSLGKGYSRNFQFSEAETTLLEATELFPNRTGAWQALIDVYYQKGNPAGVARAWSRLVELNSTRTYESYISIGHSYQAIGDFAKAREQYIKARELEPDTSDAYLALGDLDYAHNRFDDAIANYHLAENKASGRAPIMQLRLAAILRNQSRLDEAEKAVRTAILLDGGIAESYIDLARLGVVQRREALIEECRQRLTLIAPRRLYDLDKAIGDEYRASGDQEKAEGAYRDCKRRDPGRSDAYVGIGLIRISQERYWEAKRWFARALKKEKTSIEAQRGLCEIHEIEKNLQAFVAAQDRIVELNPMEKSDACIAVGRLHEKMDLLDDAEQHFRTAIGLSPWRADAYASLGSLFRRRGKLEEAMKAYEEAKQVADISYADLGAYYERQNKERDALEVYRLGLKCVPGEQKPDLYIALGLLHADLNKPEQAQEAYGEAIKLDPTREETYHRLARLLVKEGRGDEALKAYGEMVKQPQLAYAAHVSSGDLLADEHKYEDAAQFYRQAIEIDPKRAQGYLQLAVVYRQQGKAEQTEELVLQALEAAPENPEPYRWLAQIREQQQRSDEAINLYRKIMELQPAGVEISDAYVHIGNLLFAQKRYDEAVQEFQQAVQSDPMNTDAYYNLGAVFEQQDKVDSAVELYRKVLEFQPIGIAASDAYVRVGNLLRGQKRYDEAAQEFQRAIQHNPANAGTYYDLATAYEHLGDTKLALKNYIKATELAPKYRDAYVGRGRIYAKQKDTRSMARMARQILKLEMDPVEKYDAHLIIADVYRAADDVNQAAMFYRQALESYPSNREAYVLLAQLLADENRIDEALEVCRQMAKQPELALTAFISIGNLLAAQEKYDEAAQSYRQAIEAAPKESDAYLQLARLYQEQSKLEEMEKVLDQASIVVPDEPQVYRLQAELREQQGQTGEAIRLYRRVVELQPTNGASSEAYERIGNLMFDEKRYDEAEHEFQMAAQIDPVNASIHYRLGALYEKQDNIERALVSYTKATEIAPKHGAAYRALSLIYAKKGDTKGLAQIARQILELELSPADQYEAYLMIGNAYQEAELYEWAIDHLHKAVSLAPERLEAYSALGLIYEIQQSWGKARDVYEKIGQLSPESQSDVHFRLGQLYLLEQKPEEAEKEFELVKNQVFLANHERVELLRTAYLVIASIYRKQGNLEAMRKSCAEVLSQLQSDHSPDQNARRHQGLACLMLGQYEEAVDALRHALELNAADAKARLYLAVGLLTLNDISGAHSQLKKAIEQIQYKEDYDVAIEEAETLATKVPEVAGANDVVQTLREASNKAPSREIAQA